VYSIVLMAALTTGAAEPGFGWRCGCHGYSACHGCSGVGCYGCGGGYAYNYGACCGCYGASAYFGYGYCSGMCYGGYCMGGFTNYAPAVNAPAPTRPEKPEVVPPPKGKPKVDETSLNNQARLIVEVPADAKLLIDGTPMKSNSRVFRTPKLDPKLSYYYDVTAEVVRDGKTVSSTKRVIVRAGEEVHTAFADLPANKGEATANAGK
jgi:uncharacterized protein (TIGR03000 family)